MSGRLVGTVLRHSRHADASLRLALCAIAEATNDETGKCWLSIATIAERLGGKTTRWTKRLLRALEDSGELHIAKGAGPHGTNLYTINLPGSGVQATGGAHATPGDTRPGLSNPQGGGAHASGAQATGWSAEHKGGGVQTPKGVAYGPPEPELNRNLTVPEAHVDNKAKVKAIVHALKKQGIDAAPIQPLVEAVRLGASLEDCHAAITACEDKGDPFKYAMTVLRNRLRTSGPRASEDAAGEAWEATRSSIEAEGVRLGIGKWDQFGYEVNRKGAELSTVHRARSRQARRGGSRMTDSAAGPSWALGNAGQNERGDAPVGGFQVCLTGMGCK